MSRAAAYALLLAAGCCAAQEQGSLRGALWNSTENGSVPLLAALAASQAGLTCSPTFRLPFWPTSANTCLWTGSCCDPRMTCYMKQPGLFAACLPSCRPGVHYEEPIFFWYPWRCDVVPDKYLPTPAPAPAPAPAPVGPSTAETFTFYMYRAQSSANYAPKNVNTASLAGVMWYLVHEVMISDPPKFGVERVLRYKVQTKAPQRLIDAGMNFGVRYAYDSQACTGPGDCAQNYHFWGNFVGCNDLGNFPYPKFETYFPGGVWYSLPGDGQCASPPTGAYECTYSWEPAGEISLKEINDTAIATGISDVFKQTNNSVANLAKTGLLRTLFESKYPDMPKGLDTPPCDFSYAGFYPNGLN